jgi:short-subunit dehydrogenase
MTNRKDKTVLITGAANGLGKALAFEFSRLGYNLALIDIDSAGLQTLQQDLKTADQKITVHQNDISEEQNVIYVREDILSKHNRIDILVNNAGVSISQTFDLLEIVDFQKLFATNFWGTIYYTKHFLPDLKKQNDSRLVNIISDFALMGFPGKTAYSSSKSAILGFSNSLKTELTGTTVKVSIVIPPPLDTGLVIKGKHIDEAKKQKEAAFLQKNGMHINKAAKLIVRQIEKGKFRIVIGTMMFWIDIASRLFPSLLHRLIGKNKNKIDFV